jgi:hypothetical protein
MRRIGTAPRRPNDDDSFAHEDEVDDDPKEKVVVMKAMTPKEDPRRSVVVQ